MRLKEFGRYARLWVGALGVSALVLVGVAHAGTYGRAAGGGGGAGTVTTDTTLTGDGSSGTPLGINPVASRAPDFQGYWLNFFQQRTGLSPLQFSVYTNDFTEFSRVALSNTTAGQGAIVGGTGATASYSSTLAGGVLKLFAPSSGAGFADWNNGGSGVFKTIVNIQTKRWLVAYRIAIGTAPSSASRIVAGLYDGTHIMGIGYSGAQTHWFFSASSTNATNTTDLGKAIDSSGTVFLWMYMANFDLSNVVGSPDVVGGVAESTFAAAATFPTTSAQYYIWNEGTGTADIVNVDAVVGITER